MTISITFPSIITTILSYETSHNQVATNSDVKVKTIDSLETQQPILSHQTIAIQPIQQSLSKSSTYSTII